MARGVYDVSSVKACLRVDPGKREEWDPGIYAQGLPAKNLEGHLRNVGVITGDMMLPSAFRAKAADYAKLNDEERVGVYTFGGVAVVFKDPRFRTTTERAVFTGDYTFTVNSLPDIFTVETRLTEKNIGWTGRNRGDIHHNVAAALKKVIYAALSSKLYDLAGEQVSSELEFWKRRTRYVLPASAKKGLSLSANPVQDVHFRFKGEASPTEEEKVYFILEQREGLELLQKMGFITIDARDVTKTDIATLPGTQKDRDQMAASVGKPAVDRIIAQGADTRVIHARGTFDNIFGPNASQTIVEEVLSDWGATSKIKRFLQVYGRRSR